MISDIAADGDRFRYCGRLLYQNFSGKRTLTLLREWDGDVVFATMVDVTCGWCGAVNEIFYIADMLPTISTTPTRRGGFAWVPAI